MMISALFLFNLLLFLPFPADVISRVLDVANQMANSQNQRDRNLTAKSGDVDDDFFADYAILVMEYVYYGDLYYHWDMCYTEDLEKMCDFGQQSQPVDAKFNEETMTDIKVPLDEIVDAGGKTLVKMGGQMTEFCVDMTYCRDTWANPTDMKKMATALWVPNTREPGAGTHVNHATVQPLTEVPPTTKKWASGWRAATAPFGSTDVIWHPTITMASANSDSKSTIMRR